MAGKSSEWEDLDFAPRRSSLLMGLVKDSTFGLRRISEGKAEKVKVQRGEAED